MIDRPCVHVIRKTDRLYRSLHTFLIAHAAIAHSVFALMEGSRGLSLDDEVRLTSLQTGLDVVVPVIGPVEFVLRDIEPDEFSIAFKKQERWVSDPSTIPYFSYPARTQITVKGFRNAIIGVLSSIFIAFYEDYRQGLWENVGKPELWPEVWRFGKAVRDAIAHNSIDMRPSKHPPVSWKNLVYSPSDNGKSIIGREIDIGDMLALMIEMDEALCRAGCKS